MDNTSSTSDKQSSYIPSQPSNILPLAVDVQPDLESGSKQKYPQKSYPEDEVDRFVTSLNEAIVAKFRAAPLNEIFLVFTSIALVIVGCVQAFVAWKSYNDTSPLVGYARESTVAAQRNAAAAEGFACSAEHIRQGVGDAVTKLEAQAKAIDKARTTSETTSQRSLRTTIDVFHQEQRSWIGLTILGVAPDPAVIPGTVVAANNATLNKFVGVIINTGKTPARHIKAVIGMDTRKGFYTPSEKDEEWMTRVIAARKAGTLEGVLAIVAKPPTVHDLHQFIHDVSLVPPGEADWSNSLKDVNVGVLAPNIPYPFPVPGDTLFGDGLTVIVFGEVSYRDVFSMQERKTIFCNYTFDVNHGKFGACPIYNDMQ